MADQKIWFNILIYIQLYTRSVILKIKDEKQILHSIDAKLIQSEKKNIFKLNLFNIKPIFTVGGICKTG